MAVTAGKLDRRIRILFPVKTQNAAGETTIDYPLTLSIDTWAGISQPFGREVVKNNLTISTTAYTITIRYRPTIVTGCRILYRGRTLEVASVLDNFAGSRQEEMELVAYENVPSGGM